MASSNTLGNSVTDFLVFGHVTADLQCYFLHYIAEHSHGYVCVSALDRTKYCIFTTDMILDPIFSIHNANWQILLAVEITPKLTHTHLFTMFRDACDSVHHILSKALAQRGLCYIYAGLLDEENKWYCGQIQEMRTEEAAVQFRYISKKQRLRKPKQRRVPATRTTVPLAAVRS